MARIRTIKPDFWSNAQVMECSLNARLLFIGMWNFADDKGRMALSPKSIRAQVFPSDNISPEKVLGMLSELSKNDLIFAYVIEGKPYIQITGWHHQRIDKPQKPKCPEPTEHSKIVLGMVAADLTVSNRIGGPRREGKSPTEIVVEDTGEVISIIGGRA